MVVPCVRTRNRPPTPDEGGDGAAGVAARSRRLRTGKEIERRGASDVERHAARAGEDGGSEKQHEYSNRRLQHALWVVRSS